MTKTTSIVLFLLIFSCQKNESNYNKQIKEKPIFTIAPPIKDVLLPSETFKVDNSKDTLLVSKRGCVVSVPKNCFVDKNGILIEDVSIKLDEYLKPSEILLSGIPMQYIEGEDTMDFQSAGMCNIIGNDKTGNPVFIRKDKSLEIGLRSMAQENNYNLYYFDTLKGKWIEKQKSLEPLSENLPIAPASLSNVDTNRILSITIENYEIRPLYSMWHKSKFKVHGNQKFEKSDNKTWWYDMEINFTKYADLYDLTFYGINEDSKQVKYTLTVQPLISAENYDSECELFKKNMKIYLEEVRLAKLRQVRIEKKVKTAEDFFKKQKLIDSLHYALEYKKDSIYRISYEKSLRTRKEVMRMFEIRQFGVYNCDRFYKQGQTYTKNISFTFNNESIIFDQVFLVSSLENAVLNNIIQNGSAYFIRLGNQNYDFVGVKKGVIYHTRLNSADFSNLQTSIPVQTIELSDLSHFID